MTLHRNYQENGVKKVLDSLAMQTLLASMTLHINYQENSVEKVLDSLAMQTLLASLTFIEIIKRTVSRMYQIP